MRGATFSSPFDPEMQLLALVLFITHLQSLCFYLATSLNSIRCSQGLGCQLKENNVLCIPGEVVSDPVLDPVLVPAQINTRNKLRCQEQQDCIPCVQVMLRLGLLESPVLRAKQDEGADKISLQSKKHDGNAEKPLRTHIRLEAEAYSSSRCVEVEVWLPNGWEGQNNSLGFLQFDCFPIALRGEMRLTVSTWPRYRSAGGLEVIHHGPECKWSRARAAVRLCQVPSLAISVGSQMAVLHVQDIPEGQQFELWLYQNRTGGLKALGQGTTKLLTGPENVSLPISQAVFCLCFQVWPKIKDQADPPRTHLCPFANDPRALARAWAQSHLKVQTSAGRLSCFFSGPCDLQGELVPCWRMGQLACHPLHPQLHLILIPQEWQEFPRLKAHPNLCVQVRSKGSVNLQSCLQDNITESHQPMKQHVLCLETPDSQGNPFVHLLEQGTWVPLAQAISTRNGNLEEELRNNMQIGKCMKVWQAEGANASVVWACSLEKHARTHWALIWIVAFLVTCSILLMFLFKKEAVKAVLQGRHVLILYSPDHEGYERVVGTLAGALTQLQLSVSLELWSRGELGSLGPMQWLHAQRRLVLQEGGAVVLLFSQSAVASCAQWLGGAQKDTRPTIQPDSTFLASLNCILPDFLAGEPTAMGMYTVGFFEELLSGNEIPGLFRSVPIYPLPSQLFSFLLALAGPQLGHKWKSILRKQAAGISQSLKEAVRECQRKHPSQSSPLGRRMARESQCVWSIQLSGLSCGLFGACRSSSE